MRTVIAAVALLAVTGTAKVEAAPQDEGEFVFRRICNIQPGQEAAAMALAQEMVDLVERNYPGVEMAALTGRWMTGFQNIERPVNQILFSERHPDAEMRQEFTEILMGDPEFRALQLKMLDAIDFSRCAESRIRAPSSR